MLAPNQYQAQYSVIDLTLGNTPTGAEWIEAIQKADGTSGPVTAANGQSVRLTLTQIFAALSIPVVAPTIRTPVFAATVASLTSDIEVGVSTVTSAVLANLPSAATWAAAFPGGATGLELVILDRTGNAGVHNVTFGLNGGDTFLQGVAPVITSNFGALRLRPSGSPVNGWYIKGLG